MQAESALPFAAEPAVPNLLDCDAPALRSYFTHLGEAGFRARQVLRWIHRRGVLDFARMTDLGTKLRERLCKAACLATPRLGDADIAPDGVRKWQVLLADGAVVEMVLIPERTRATLCLSTQAGCPLRCDFCATGRQGFTRNLRTAEIIGQFWLAVREMKAFGSIPGSVTNVVMMGMGEPLLNLDAVLRAVHLLRDDHCYGLARRRVTISTAGVVPGIRRLARERVCALAVSLHAGRNELRDRLVPLNRHYPLEQLIPACREHARECGAVTFEYTLLDGINDSPRDAREVAELVRGMPAKINLIPFNPFPGSGYRRPPPEAIRRFQDLLARHGYPSTVRKTRGDSIAAACGQLTSRTPPCNPAPQAGEPAHAWTLRTPADPATPLQPLPRSGLSVPTARGNPAIPGPPGAARPPLHRA